MHEPLLHVPLVVRYPKGGFAGRRVSEPVSTIDLFATVLAQSRVGYSGAAGLHSRSLLEKPAEYVYSQLVHAYAVQLRPIHKAYPDLDLSPWTRTYDVIRRGPMKLVDPSDAPPALYDLTTDPGENSNLASARPAEAAQLEGALNQWLAERAPYVPGEPGQRELTPEQRAQLEIRGYVEGED